MSTSYTRSTLAVRGLSVLRSVGAWVAISPEQTYVATTIRGLGPCKSTYCRAERRELPPSARVDARSKWVPLVAAALASVGLLASCATYQPGLDGQGVADRDQTGPALADCQNLAGPVRPAGSAGTGSERGSNGCVGMAFVGVDFAVERGNAAGDIAVAGRQAETVRAGGGERGDQALN